MPHVSRTAYIFGSRKVTNARLVYRVLSTNLPVLIDTVYSGGARGADLIAELWCSLKGNIKVNVIRPHWIRHGRSAGIRRNCEIITSLPPNSLCICFAPPGVIRGRDITPGSRHAIGACAKAGHRVLIAWADGFITSLPPLASERTIDATVASERTIDATVPQ